MAKDPQRLVPCHRVEPGAQPVGVAQPVESGCRDDEGVLHGVGGIGRVAQQRPAVLVEGIRVPVVDDGEPSRVA